MNKDYYSEYFQFERNHWWFRIRERIIISQLQKVTVDSNDLKILNIGVATGRSTEALSPFGEVTSLEYDKDCCAFLKEELGFEVINGSITELPFNLESFDLVCAFDVIEHVENHDLAVKEMERVCKKNGIIFITVPAFMSLWSHHDIINQHFRRYKSNSLLSLFNLSSLQLIHKTYFNTFLFIPIIIFRTFSRIVPQKMLRRNSGSDFNIKGQTKILNTILERIFRLEIALLKLFQFPFGVSLLGIWKKC